jgi:hypothetical protein
MAVSAADMVQRLDPHGPLVVPFINPPQRLSEPVADDTTMRTLLYMRPYLERR